MSDGVVSSELRNQTFKSFLSFFSLFSDSRPSKVLSSWPGGLPTNSFPLKNFQSYLTRSIPLFHQSWRCERVLKADQGRRGIPLTGVPSRSIEDVSQYASSLTLLSHLVKVRAVVIYKSWKNSCTMLSWEKRHGQIRFSVHAWIEEWSN